MLAIKEIAMKNLIIPLLLLAPFFGLTQQTEVFRDDFNNNVHDWYHTDEADALVAVGKGVYTLHKKTTGGSWRSTYQISIDPQKDYEIEAKLRHTGSGTEDNGFGLMAVDYRKSGDEIWNYFLVAATPYYQISRWSEASDETDVKVKWKKDKSLVNAAGSYNTLRVHKKGGVCRYYVNDEEVYSDSKEEFWGTYIGFIVYGNQRIEIDHFVIKQDGREMNVVENAEQGYQKESLGPNVNIEGISDLGPVISPDGQTLYIFRKEYEQNMGSNNYDDIWVSQRQEDDSWSMMTNIGRPLNNESHNFVAAITPDGNKMLVANTYNSKGEFDGLGVSLSQRGSKGWGLPKTVKIDNFYNNNTYGNYFMSADGRYILMSIERNDSYGECDLYVSFKLDDYHYTEPKNLGTTINTFAYEGTPFLAADNVTMYFPSPGHPSIGSTDIFVTRRLDDTWTNWSEPENLGPEINTTGWDSYYTIPASGEVAYLVQEGDIYRIKLPEKAKPKPVVLIKGKVLNSKNNEPLEASITYYDLATGEEMGTALSNADDGGYQIILPYGRRYSFLAAKPKFISVSENMDVSDITEYAEIEKDLYLSPIEVGQVVRLNNIFFELNKSDLLPESSAELDRLIQLMNENKKMVIEIGGHTDNQGSDEYNMNLSQQRVNSVVSYLTKNGINAKRLTGKGYGESSPVATNDTEEGRELNRRVEFRIVSM